MQTARFIEPGKIKISQEEMPVLNSTEILVKVKSAGICGTDLQIFHGTNKGLVKPGTVLGHEFSGLVEKVGDKVIGFQKGDKVAIEPNLYCGKCHYCRNAKKHFCENWAAIGLTRDGGFQEFCAIPATAAYKIPNSVTFETAAFFEPLACVLHGIKRSKIQLGETVVLQGAGGIGQLFIKVLSLMGLNNIIVCDINDKKLELARKNGATYTINVKNENLNDTVKRITDGLGAQVMIDAAGLVSTIPDGISLLENTGRILIFGVPPESKKVEMIPYDVYKKEIEILGSYTNPYSNEDSVKMLQKISTTDLITNPITLGDIVDGGLKMIGKEDVLKVQVQFK